MTPDQYGDWATRARARLVRETQRRCPAAAEAVVEDCVADVIGRWFVACDGLATDADAEAACRHAVGRAMIDWMRHQQTRWQSAEALVAEAPVVETPAEVAEGVIRQSAVQHALAALPERQRALIWRVVALGENVATVAAELGVPYRTARRDLKRARTALRGALREYAPRGHTASLQPAPRSSADSTSPSRVGSVL